MPNNRKTRSGFTMIELMAVLVIVGLLFAVAANNFMGKTDDTKVTTTKVSLRILDTAIIQYKMDTGEYPDEDMGLQALVEAPAGVDNWDPSGYLKSTDLPTDGWGNDFEYQLNPESGKAFVVISWGADGEPEGEEYDEDLLSTDAN